MTSDLATTVCELAIPRIDILTSSLMMIVSTWGLSTVCMGVLFQSALSNYIWLCTVTKLRELGIHVALVRRRTLSSIVINAEDSGLMTLSIMYLRMCGSVINHRCLQQ